MISAVTTPAEFFLHILTEDVNELLRGEPTLRAAYHACTSLLSYRDWVLRGHKDQSWFAKGNPMGSLTGTNAFQTSLETLDHSFAITTDIANASKHMILDPDRSRTNLWGSANTAFDSIGGSIGESSIGETAIGASEARITVKIDNDYHDVCECVRMTFRIWKELNTENGW